LSVQVKVVGTEGPKLPGVALKELSASLFLKVVCLFQNSNDHIRAVD